MKVIDLLNKIAKGEEVPDKIKYKGTTYEKDNDGDIDFYIGENFNGTLFLEELDNTNELNDEIEIIEEKEIEEINKSYPIFHFDEKSFAAMKEMIQDIYSKQCEIIRELNKIKKEGK